MKCGGFQGVEKTEGRMERNKMRSSDQDQDPGRGLRSQQEDSRRGCESQAVKEGGGG